MKRQIFVGSSSEGLPQAKVVCEFLTDPTTNTECLLWPDVFEPGYLTFEALENVLGRVCAAVLIATPDDSGTMHGRTIKMPRANVMLEFGLLAGRLGRHNVAVCQFGDVEMPSDLQGMTVVRMGGDQDSSSKQKLATWRSKLLPTLKTIARTDVVHGYSGDWFFQITLDHWRGVPISPPSTALATGTLSLYVDPEGTGGAGFAWGHLTSEI
jgi:predicted nucleotide-binding protein